MLLKKYIYTNYPMDSWESIRALFYVYSYSIQMFMDGANYFNDYCEKFHIIIRTDWENEAMGAGDFGVVFYVKIDDVHTKVIVKKAKSREVLEVMDEFLYLYCSLKDCSLN